MKKIDYAKLNSLIKVADYFDSEKKCQQILEDSYWGDDVVCPKCGKHHCKMSESGRYHCTECNHNFSCTVGTIFENSKLSLRQWFFAIYMITSNKKGAGEVLSVFDRTMRFDLREGIPLLTTKKVFYRGCIVELLWFLSGDTNIKYLIDNNVNIWTDDAYRYYRELCEKHNNDLQYYGEGDGYVYGERKPLEKDDFIASVQGGCTEQFIFRDPKDDEFYECNYTYGDLGDVYGKQWRKFGHSGFDQIQHIIDTLRENPDDRRMLCVAYNPDALYALDGVALPPCHVMFQFWARELTEQERLRLVPEEELKKAAEDWTVRMDELNIPKRELSCSFNCRSQDLPLGTPFNLASYSFLTHIIAKLVNMVPGELIYHGGDCHIYLNQMDGVKEQLTRNGSDVIPKLKFTEGKEFKEISDFAIEDFIIYDYNPDPTIKFPLSVG